jgi:diguanylate cyclase (GGDEF)-like protein
MSLIRQIWLLIIVTLVLAFAGSFGVWIVSARSYLETQLRLKNADNAQSLALTLSQQKGDLPAMELAVSAMFDTGFYQRILLKDAGGRTVVARESRSAVVDDAPPAWFYELVPVDSPVGVAQVSDGWRALGSVEVTSQSGFAHAQLWQGCMKTAGWLSVLGVLASLVALAGVRRIRAPLDATVAQAQALMERRFLTVREPAVPELAALSQAMNAVVLRLKTVFDEQSTQVEHLRQQAHCDALTGLSHRRHFMLQLSAALQAEAGSGSGVVYLIRLVDLAGINRVLGHRMTDALLQRLATTLREVVHGLPDVALGRLNGGDFALCMTEADQRLPEPTRFVDALRSTFGELAVPVHVVMGAVHWERGMSLQQVLAAADSALARAEARGGYAVEQVQDAKAPRLALGEDEWRQRLSAALDAHRLQLVTYPVVDKQMMLVHHECPMRLQLEEGGVFEAAHLWLPMAMRTGLIGRIDEQAVAMALRAIAEDSQPRSVNLSPASLADSGFVPRLRALLALQQREAKSLWLEVAEVAAIERFEQVRELCKQLRPLGARVGLEHAGERLTRIELLFEVGLDYVKLDASVVQGVAQDGNRAAFVSATVGMLHGLGLQVLAEGVSDATDIPALRQAGVDGWTGPAVRLSD